MILPSQHFIYHQIGSMYTKTTISINPKNDGWTNWE